jgi:hypothetical protein
MDTKLSDRKIAANRENAKKSTGPRTAPGKAVSSLNAMTHGIFAKHAVATAPFLMENPADYLALLESIRAQFSPSGILEDSLVQAIASDMWNAGRHARVQSANITARVYEALSAAARENEGRDWVQMHLRKPPTLSSYTGKVTAEMVRAQIDLVQHLNEENTRYEEIDEFLAFVWKTKLASSDDATGDEHFPASDEQMAKARAHLANLADEDRQELEEAFESAMATGLRAMREERAYDAAKEIMVERALIPNEGELDRLMRYDSHLSRSLERKIELLLKLQAERKARDGGGS